jgi:copper chaperone
MGDQGMSELKVTGMTCGHCEMAVRRALEAVPGVTAVKTVDRARQLAVVEGDAEIAALIAAVKAEGYEASPL